MTITQNAKFEGFDESELLYDVCGNISTLGFNINSLLLKSGINPTSTFTNINDNGIGLLFNYNNLVVPSWLLSYPNLEKINLNSKSISKNKFIEEVNYADDELINKLLDLVTFKQEVEKQNKKQRSKTLFKRKNKQNNKTHKKTK